jgi:hypothetical protein
LEPPDGFTYPTGELEKKAAEMLDSDTGMLPRSLEEFRQKLEGLLGDAFDPDSKKSVIALFEEVMRKAAGS